MKRYTYNISVVGKHLECASVRQAAELINSAVGVPLVSPHMILNYFSRPHVVNKRLFFTVGHTN